MIRARTFLGFALTAALAAAPPMAMADQLLPSLRITGNATGSGDLKAGDLKIGKRQGGKLILQPDAVEGDGSAMAIKPSLGTTQPRTNADRSSDSLNFLDQVGADATGVAEQFSVINRAMNEAASAGKPLVVPSGKLRMRTGSPDLPPNTPLIFGGVQFDTNGNYIGGTSDFTPFIGAKVTSAWMRRTDRPGNEWGTFTNLDILQSPSTEHYIKGAAYFIATTSDYSPSTLLGAPKDINKDAVGILATSGINAGNMRGRAFAGNFYASAPAGSDGNLNGLEVDVGNNTGNDQPLTNKHNSKTGISIVAIGNTPNTNALVVTGETGGWHHGLDVQAQTIAAGGTAWRLTSPTDSNVAIAALDKDANLFAKALRASGDNAALVQGAASGGAASLTSTAGALSVTASGGNPTYLGSGTSTAIVQGSGLVGGTLTVGTANGVAVQGGASSAAAASISSLTGPLSVTAGGSNPTYLGSGTSATVVQSGLTVGGALNAQGNLTVLGTTRIASAAPATASAACSAGTITYDVSYVYVCVAANTWKRSALASW